MAKVSRRASLAAAVATRLTPEGTRRPTAIERRTVRRLNQPLLLRVHQWLEVTGRFATVLYFAVLATVLLGVDFRETVESALNAGRPVKGAIVVVLIVPTLAFVAARSLIGWLRWRVQRELWRRDVERLTAALEEGSSE